MTVFLQFQKRLNAFQELEKQIVHSLTNGDFDAIIEQQSIKNKWFTKENCRFALQAIVKMLDEKSIGTFFQKYQHEFTKEHKLQKIAVISAGNIPCAAFHDFFCILISGNQFIGKLSKQDALLLPFIVEKLVKIAPEFAEKIVFVEKLPKFDKIIATGSNNSARYFEYYFKETPMLLRKNRNSVAILTHNETDEDLRKLAIDVFQYFGLGCRSVSKIYVPKNYNLEKLINIFQEESQSLLFHNSYVNNYEYHRAIFALNKTPFYDGSSFLFAQNQSWASPISVIYFDEYETITEVLAQIQNHKNEIQCVVSNDVAVENRISFGDTQFPSLFDYPDNEDILLFCIS
jgi:acyl-CoA reductase-like NAD-dependent aldehyde dehydrogenase